MARRRLRQAARFDGNAAGDAQLRPHLVEGNLIWQPRFTWTLTGTVVVTPAQHGQEHPVDLSEAVLTYKPLPLPGPPPPKSARAGLFWPPVSLEHSGPDWAVADTITPSAINSWIGDEVSRPTEAAGLGDGRAPRRGDGGGVRANDTSGLCSRSAAGRCTTRRRWRGASHCPRCPYHSE